MGFHINLLFGYSRGCSSQRYWNPGGGTQLFFGGCVPHGFQNVGSRERIFLEKRGS